jgi:hypothetical protein
MLYESLYATILSYVDIVIDIFEKDTINKELFESQGVTL